MLSRRSLFAIPFLSLLFKEVEERYLIDYQSITEDRKDEFGKMYRRVLHADKIDTTWVIRAKLLKDLSLEVSEWGRKNEPYKMTIIPKDKWCISAYDAYGQLIKNITSDTFTS